MRILKRWILILFLLSFTLGCNSIQEMREAREAVEKANKEAKLILENIKGYAERERKPVRRQWGPLTNS